MTNWRPDTTALRRPVYLSLIGQITEAVRQGRLKAGDRLPTHRDLAFKLGVSVQTVSRAYDGLAKRGLIAGKVGRGTFVLESTRDASTPYLPRRAGGALIDLSIQKPVAGRRHEAAIARALDALKAQATTDLLFSFRPDAALARHKEVALTWLRRCGVDSSPENLLVTNGATSATAVALMSIAASGATIATEEITHHTVLPLAQYLGIRVIGLACDDEGACPDALDEACHEHDVCALFCLPTLCNPRLTTMSPERRHRIVQVAERHDLLIVEDDAWGPLGEDRPPPLQTFAPQRTLYVTSLTKCVMPALRLGYLVAPATLVPALRNRHLVTNWMATLIVVELASHMIERGVAAALTSWQTAALARRNAIAEACLAAIPHRAHPLGLHLWLPLPAAWPEAQFISQARLQQVAVAPSLPFRVPGTTGQGGAVRICLGSTSEGELTQGLTILRHLLSSRREPEVVAM